MSRSRLAVFVFLVAVAGGTGWTVFAQQEAQPTNDAPNPYQTIENYFKLPEGRTWGSTSAVDVSPDGQFIWVAERCGANACIDRATNTMSSLPSVLKFDQSGKLVASFGAGLLVFPHGIHVDREGNVWVTDGQDNAPQAGRGGAGGGRGAAGGGAAGGGAAAGGGDPAAGGGRGGRGGRGRGGDPAAGGAAGGGAAAGGAAAGAAGGGAAGGGAAGRGAAQAGGGAGAGRGAGPTGPNPAATIGHQVIKFSPDGKVLLRIGRAGGATGPDQCCWQPNDVITNQKGEIFVSEGHGTNPNDRILVFSPDGQKILRQFGRRGSGPGEFNQPHALAFDSQGRLFVGDRSNNRVQILDQNGKFIAEWPQFSRPSGLFIDRNDVLYSADSESGTVNPAHGAWKRGIRIGSVKDGKVTAFIPDPLPTCEQGQQPGEPRTCATGTWVAEGVAVDHQGNVYGAEVGPRKVQKYVKK